MNRYFGVLLFY